MNVKVRLREFVFVIIYLIFFVCLIIWSILNWDKNEIINYEKEIFPWLIVSIVLNLIGFCKIKKTSYTSITLWFVFCSYFFMFGHVYTHVFNLKTTLLWNPSVFFSEKEKLNGAIYTLIALTSISLGYFCFKNTNQKVKKNTYGKEPIEKKVSILGWTCFLLGFICNLLNSLIVIGKTYSAGSYLAYASASANVGLLDDFSYLMYPGVMYILSGRSLSKHKKNIFIGFVIGYFILTMVFSGSRKNQIFALIAISVCYCGTKSENRISNRAVIFIFIVGVLLLNLIYVIREHRTELNTVISQYISSLADMEFLKELVGETLTESGLTFYSVVSIVKYVPNIFPFEYGMTFLRTLLSALPIGWLIGDFLNKGASTVVINKYTGIPVGASIIGDLYWNFGCVGGVIFSFILGAIFSKIDMILFEKDEKEPMYYSIFFVLLIGLRSGFFEIFRPLIMVTVVPYIVSLFLKLKIRKR